VTTLVQIFLLNIRHRQIVVDRTEFRILKLVPEDDAFGVGGSAICATLNVALAFCSFLRDETSQSIGADERPLLSNFESMKCVYLALFWMFRIVVIMFMLMPLGIFAPIVAILISRAASQSVS
jgi:uncharacterized BrkB/YihY/UPF0761 family membrane protein